MTYMYVYSVHVLYTTRNFMVKIFAVTVVSRVSAHPPVFGLVSVSAHVPGKRPPPFFSQAKRPPPLTRSPTASVSRSACNSQATKHGQNNAGHVQNKKGLTTAHSKLLQ